MRATLPRIRIDHMLDLCWKFFTPLALATIIVTMLVDKSVTAVLPNADAWARSGILFLANLLLGWATIGLLAASARKMRLAEAGTATAGHGSPHGEVPHGEAPHNDGPSAEQSASGGHDEHAPTDAHAPTHPAPVH
jgi:NADH dehydrogenase